jgi:autotransporter-associated beta strand protein
MKIICNIALATVLTVLPATTGHAVIRNWVGGFGGHWTTSANWSPAGAPAHGDTLFFPAGSPNKNQTNNTVGVLELGGIFIQESGYSLGGTAVGVTNGIHAEFATGTASVEFITRLDADTSFIVGTGFPAATSQLSFPQNYINLNNRTLTFWASATNSLIHVSANMIDGAAMSDVGNVIKNGPGRLRYTDAKNYTGTTLVNDGTLELSGAGQAINGPLTIGDGFGGEDRDVVRYLAGDKISHQPLTILQSGFLDLNGFTESIGSLIMDGGRVATGSGWLSCTSIVASAANYGTNSADWPSISGELLIGTGLLPISVTSLNPSTTSDFYISADINGPGGIRLLPGSGDLRLSGSNSYSGPTVIEGGIIYATSSQALGSTSSGTVLAATNSCSLEFANDITGEWLTNNCASGGLRGVSEPNWSGNIVLNENIVVNDAILSGVISGTGGLRKDVNSGTVTLAGNSPNTYTGLTKLDGGVLALNKTAGNAIVGPVEIGPYTFPVGSPPVLRLLNTAMIASVPVAVNRNGLFDLNNFDEGIGALTLHSGRVETGTGTLTLLGDLTSLADIATEYTNAFINGYLALNNLQRDFIVGNGTADPDLIVQAVVSNGGITKSGAGNLFLSGANTYGGNTYVQAGVLEVSHPSALGSTLAPTAVSNGATLRINNGTVSVPEDVVLHGGGFNGTNGALHGENTGQLIGDVTLAAPSTIGVDGNNFQVSGVIGGANSLTKIGPGRLILDGNADNTFTGTTYVQAGILELAKVNGLVAIPRDLIIGDGTNSAIVVYRTGVSNTIGNFVVGTGNITINRNSVLDLNGMFEGFDAPFSGGSTTPLELYDGGSVQTGSGRLNLPAGITVIVDPTAEQSVISGRIGLAGTGITGGPQNFNVDAQDLLQISPELDVPAALEGISGITAIRKNGAGRMVLRGNNTYTGALTIQGGSVSLKHAGALGVSGGGVSVTNGAHLIIDGAYTFTGETMTLATTNPVALTTSNQIVWNGSVTLEKDAVVNAGSGSAFVILDSIGGAGRLTKIGTGTLALGGSSANTFTNAVVVDAGLLVLSNTAVNATVLGALEINGGTVRLGRNRQIANNSAVTIGAAGTLELDGYDDAIGSLAGSGNVTTATGNNFETGTDNASTTFSGVISGSANIWKHGTGTQTFSGTNTYTGATIVEGGGALIVNGAQPQSAAIVSNNATLGGSGVVGNLTVASTGKVAPGTSPGILTCSNVTFASGSTLIVELNGSMAGSGHDQLNVRGTVNLGSATLSASLGFAPVAGQPLRIINNDGSDAITGTFTGLAEGAILNLGKQAFRISYVGGTGNDVTLTHTNPVAMAGLLVSSGNGSGAIDPNECNLLSVVLTNGSATTASNVVTKLASETPGVVITQPFSAYPNLSNGATRTNDTAFQLSTTSEFVCGTAITLRLEVQTSNQGSYAVPVALAASGGVDAVVRVDNNSAVAIPNIGVTNRTFNVSGISSALARVEVSLHLTHTQDGHLDLFLISPDGTRIALSTGNGSSGDNFGASCTDGSRTYFADAATTAITAGAAPFTGTFRPEEALAAFVGKSGAAVNGTWTLEIEDTTSNATIGNYQCASLFLYPALCAAGGGLCELCPNSTLTAALGSGSLQMTNRLVLTGGATSCVTPKSCPSTTSLPVGLRPYATHVFQNGPTAACLTASVISGEAVQLTLYTNSFNPLNLCANYVADPGAATSPSVQTQSCSVIVAAGQKVIAVVNTYDAGAAADYTLRVTGGDCRPVLRITPAGANAVLDWTTAAIGYQLESTNHLGSSNPVWPIVPGTPVVVNSRHQVTNSILSTNQFFRLRKP